MIVKQTLLFKKEEKIKDEIKEDESDTKHYVCTKHYFYFWRDTKNNTGTCGYCYDESEYEKRNELKDCNKLTEELTLEQIEIIDQKMYDRLTQPYVNIRNREVKDNMKVEKFEPIEDGKYNGTIKKVEERIQPFEYTDFVVEYMVNDKKIELPFGCPSSIKIDPETGKAGTKLTKTLVEFGYELKLDQDITIEDLNKHFSGLKVTSLIKNEKGFARVMTMTPEKSKK